MAGIIVIFIAILAREYFKPRPWRASYFANISLRGLPDIIEYESSPNHNWDTRAPLKGMPPDYFSVRWESRLLVRNKTRLTFKIRADDGMQFFINEEEVLRSSPSDISGYKKIEKDFPPGAYSLRLDYFEHSLSALVEFVIEGEDLDLYRLDAPTL